MAIIDPITDNDYPTLPFKVQESGYRVTNSDDFTRTVYNGAPGRNRPGFLNGWKSARLQILFTDRIEQYAWQRFHDMEFNGTAGGIENGSMPFFAECELGGEFGFFLCQLTNSGWSKANYRGNTSVLSLDVEVRPGVFNKPDSACQQEVIDEMLKSGVQANELSYLIKGFNNLAENDMNYLNV